MKKYRNSVLRGRARPLTLAIFCSLLLQSDDVAAQPGGGGLQAASMLSLTGVPSGATPLEIYRMQRDVQYALPGGVSILDHHDLDKVYMEPAHSDERYLYAEDGNSNRIMIRQVVDPASQFNPQTLPHSYSVLYRDTARFYSAGGSVLFTVLYNEGIPLSSDTTGMGSWTLPDTLPDGKLVMSIGDLEVVADIAEGLIFRNTYDGIGQWLRREVMQYDTDTTSGHPTIYRLVIEREEAPSGACIYRVETERYSEYGIWGTGLRSAQADPVMYAAPGKLTLSPNPTEDVLRIQLPDAGAELKVTIYALDGTVMQERRQGGGTVWEADISSLAPGVYLVRAEAGGQYWIEKVIRR